LRLGIISDTHGLFDPSLPSLFAGVAMIIHAGDIGKIEVIGRLQELAPVIAVKGNNDHFDFFPEQRIEEVCGKHLLIRHIFGELHQLRRADHQLIEQTKPSVVIFGHSHRPYSQLLGSTLLFNPGSAGPKRFSLPRTIGFLTVTPERIDSEVVNL
jgi:uncharacterized protein